MSGLVAKDRVSGMSVYRNMRLWLAAGLAKEVAPQARTIAQIAAAGQLS
jgi:hypothetical protein